jgi:alanyl-tRNA synthetase
MLTSAELRRRYIEFFESKGHLALPSASLVPHDDPSMLWTSAGMVPFKKYFSGKATPPKTRITTVQKCLRTQDIDSVGRTARHQTFFEMLGNFSFGDYFKEEAIEWAWEFLTEDIGLDAARLWITIYHDDDEAFDIWHDKMGIPADRIVRLGKDTNFWEIGQGACGPCSEIHFDQGSEVGCGRADCNIECECDRFLEIWNLVFTQFDKKEDGSYEPLPKKNIDTGMGLERLASVAQGVQTNFDTDLFIPIIEETGRITNRRYKSSPSEDMAFKVIADHIRAVTFAVSEGILPSNEGRGYVIRRLLRRAARYGRVLGMKEAFLHNLVDVVIDVMGEAYPELHTGSDYISEVVKGEEERFLLTLDQGMAIFTQQVEKIREKGEKIIPGEAVFKLYDTYGLPVELTAELAQEKGLDVDEEGFCQAIEEQRARARAAREGLDIWASDPIYMEFREDIEPVEFLGYTTLSSHAKIIGIIGKGELLQRAGKGSEVAIILDRTPFYAESGGQVGDKGVIKGSTGRGLVSTTEHPIEGLIVHRVEVKEGELAIGDEVIASIDPLLRKETACNHTATHLIHRALKEVLGEHVHQAGSLVSAERARFDFNHYAALTPDDMKAVERLVNEKIMEDIPVEIKEMSFDEAMALGATALFDDKYGDVVRVVKIGDFSLELCGGTHAGTTGEIGVVRLLSESSIAAGIRRIEALSRMAALEYGLEREKALEQTAHILKVAPLEVADRVEKLTNKVKDLEDTIDHLKRDMAISKVDSLISKAKEADGIKFLVAQVDGMDGSGLRELGDSIKEALGSSVVVLATKSSGKALFLATVTKDLIGKKGFHSCELVKMASAVAGGGGGGRPDMAQAGGGDPSKIDLALKKIEETLKVELGCKVTG